MGQRILKVHNSLWPLVENIIPARYKIIATSVHVYHDNSLAVKLESDEFDGPKDGDEIPQVYAKFFLKNGKMWFDGFTDPNPSGGFRVPQEFVAELSREIAAEKFAASPWTAETVSHSGFGQSLAETEFNKAFDAQLMEKMRRVENERFGLPEELIGEPDECKIVERT